MILSRYTFTFPSTDGRLFLINYLTGSLDEVDGQERAELEQRIKENRWDGFPLAGYLLERGYLFADESAEEELIQEKFLEFQDEYDRTPVQLIFSTTYACNLACVYCYQESYREDSKILTPEITEAFFRHIDSRFANESVRPYITLFGGEPLLGAERYRRNLIHFLEQARLRDYAICIVTNGYELESYLPEFQRTGVTIREIQVTLDGGARMQNTRRPTAGGLPTFDRVSAGISAALRSGHRVNLRMIVDKDNIQNLVELAEHAQRQGWMDYADGLPGVTGGLPGVTGGLPGDTGGLKGKDPLFETTIGRNYELHTCQPRANLFDRVSLWQEFTRIAEKHPILAKFHRPQFHGMRYLKETGNLPMPIFDGCPAAKKEWAFDLNGDIFGCTASVGVERYRLGNFLHGPSDDESRQYAAQKQKWETRDVLAIPECNQCPASLSCGGGCGVLAANRTGEIHSADCRPVRELLGIGAGYYSIGVNSDDTQSENSTSG